MGILRTDKISGLEKPTAVTGSVEFDGNDHLEIGSAGDFNFLHNALSDWTAECWVKSGDDSRQFVFGTGASSAQVGFSLAIMSTDDNQSDGTGVFAMFGRGSSGNYRYWGSNSGLVLNTWHHIAAVFKASDKTLTLYVDGREVDSGTGTANGTFSTTDYSTSNSSFPFVVAENQHADTYLTGYVSNLRVVDGRRLYTSNFTPPVHELEPINGTRILCCHNPDSVTAFSNAGIGTVRTVATGGDPSVGTASTEFPGLTRDFTYGTEFKGVTTFDTQGYFVPPSGTTEQRYSKGVGNGRALFTGGYDSPATINTIDYITVSTTGNAKDFGDLVSIRLQPGSLASSTRGLIGGGRNPGVTSDIDFVTIASTGNGFDFGDLTAGRRAMAALSNSSRGIWAGGDSPSRRDIIDFVTISTTSNAVDFGDLSEATNTFEGCSSSTRGLLMGGENATSPGGTNDISFFTIASLGNAQDFGNLTEGRRGPGSCSSSTRGLCGGGFDSPSLKDTIDFVTIASTGNATDFGNLTVARWLTTSTSNSIRGVWGGGYVPSPAAEQDVIDYVTIASTGNAVDFGNLQTSRRSLSSCSDSHGGLS